MWPVRCLSNNNLEVSVKRKNQLPHSLREELVFLYSHIHDTKVGEIVFPISLILYITQYWNYKMNHPQITKRNAQSLSQSPIEQFLPHNYCTFASTIGVHCRALVQLT